MTANIVRKSVKVALSTPVVWFDQVLKEVEIEEPSSFMFFEIGEPSIIAHHGETASIVDVPENIIAYLERCLKVENAGAFIRALPLTDGKELKKALLGFFVSASPGKTSQPSSA